MRANRRCEGARSYGGSILEIVPVAWHRGALQQQNQGSLTMRLRCGPVSAMVGVGEEAHRRSTMLTVAAVVRSGTPRHLTLPLTALRCQGPSEGPEDLRIANASRILTNHSSMSGLPPECPLSWRCGHILHLPPPLSRRIPTQRLRHRSKPSRVAPYTDSADSKQARLPDSDTSASRPVPKPITTKVRVRYQ
jgi:hypothetical protein